jgi:hypothetical protein
MHKVRSTFRTSLTRQTEQQLQRDLTPQQEKEAILASSRAMRRRFHALATEVRAIAQEHGVDFSADEAC